MSETEQQTLTARSGRVRAARKLLRRAGRRDAGLFLAEGPQAVREGLRGGDRRLAFDPDAEGPTWLADPAVPSAAVAHDEAFLLDVFASVGLKPAKPAVYGTWCGRTNAVSYQDLLVLEKAALP